MYAVRMIAGKEKRKYWLVEAEWVEASTTSLDLDELRNDEELKTFRTENAAHKFMKTFQGHPIWAIPVHEYWLVKVKRKKKLVSDGWEGA